MLKRKLSVKTLNEKCKALKKHLRHLIKMLPKSSSTQYNFDMDQNKEKYFKVLEDKYSSKKRKLRENDFEKLGNVVF